MYGTWKRSRGNLNLRAKHGGLNHRELLRVRASVTCWTTLLSGWSRFGCAQWYEKSSTSCSASCGIQTVYGWVLARHSEVLGRVQGFLNPHPPPQLQNIRGPRPKPTQLRRANVPNPVNR